MASYPRFGYKPTRPFPHRRRRGNAGLMRDAIDGHTFGTDFAVETDAGLVDGRVTNNIDNDRAEHEFTPGNITRAPNT